MMPLEHVVGVRPILTAQTACIVFAGCCGQSSEPADFLPKQESSDVERVIGIASIPRTDQALVGFLLEDATGHDLHHSYSACRGSNCCLLFPVVAPFAGLFRCHSEELTREQVVAPSIPSDAQSPVFPGLFKLFEQEGVRRFDGNSRVLDFDKTVGKCSEPSSSTSVRDPAGLNQAIDSLVVSEGKATSIVS